MKVLLDIEENKAQQLLKALQELPYVKTKQLTNENAEFVSDMKEAVDELKSILKGEIQARNAEDFLNEL